MMRDPPLRPINLRGHAPRGTIAPDTIESESKTHRCEFTCDHAVIKQRRRNIRTADGFFLPRRALQSDLPSLYHPIQSSFSYSRDIARRRAR